MVALEGLEVVHKVFGNGIVEKVSDKYVTVRFANLQKVFVYPDAFDVFLAAVDEAVARDIAADLAREGARGIDARSGQRGSRGAAAGDRLHARPRRYE